MVVKEVILFETFSIRKGGFSMRCFCCSRNIHVFNFKINWMWVLEKFTISLSGVIQMWDLIVPEKVTWWILCAIFDLYLHYGLFGMLFLWPKKTHKNSQQKNWKYLFHPASWIWDLNKRQRYILSYNHVKQQISTGATNKTQLHRISLNP